jgi:hypothetical protein
VCSRRWNRRRAAQSATRCAACLKRASTTAVSRLPSLGQLSGRRVEGCRGPAVTTASGRVDLEDVSGFISAWPCGPALRSNESDRTTRLMPTWPGTAGNTERHRCNRPLAECWPSCPPGSARGLHRIAAVRAAATALVDGSRSSPDAPGNGLQHLRVGQARVGRNGSAPRSCRRSPI